MKKVGKSDDVDDEHGDVDGDHGDDDDDQHDVNDPLGKVAKCNSQ